MPVLFDALTHVGTVREHNEDAILSHPVAGVWLVADGMGGHEGGAYASQCIIKHLQAGCDRYKGNYLVERIRHFLSEAHQEIFQHSQQLTNQPIIGSTVVVLALESDNYHCFWSGDSRCYLYREPELGQLTRDHSEAETMRNNGESLQSLSPDEQRRAENTLVHAIGIDGGQPYIEYTSGHLYEKDRFFLCSDGINKVYSDHQLAERLSSDDAVKTINHQMTKDAIISYAPDNLSNIIVDLS
ncbi:MAG: serine/threonine-protein phosphatase [Cellvibrionaceae bacterium]|nr:serine/threonine-protein phosphatase [Cellvibrionaceae bacterium]